jgi:hypothetical protein
MGVEFAFRGERPGVEEDELVLMWVGSTREFGGPEEALTSIPLVASTWCASGSAVKVEFLGRALPVGARLAGVVLLANAMVWRE